MRKLLLISLMTATMFVPAAAKAEDGGFLRGMRNQAERSSQQDNDSGTRSSRSQTIQRGERSSSERPARAERSPREDRASRVEQVQRVNRPDDGDRAVQRVERIRRADRDVQRLDRRHRGGPDVAQVEQVQATEPARRTQRTGRRDNSLVGVVGRTNDRDNDRDWRRDRDGDRDWRRDRDGRDWRGDRDGRHRWDRDWRRDDRYDWWSYRNRYRSLFRLGRYYDPYGRDYRRFSTGFSLWPGYYGSSFWLDDPWRYRLPPAYGSYRWIRYYDDALLVNIHTGHVVDEIHNVFW